MQIPHSRLLLIALLVAHAGAAAAATFTSLGSLRNGGTSRALGVSGDGRVAVGSSSGISPIIVESFRWTADEGMVGIGVLPGGNNSRAEGASYDGDVIGGDGKSVPVGCEDNPQTPVTETCTEGYVWMAGVGMVGTGDLPGALFASSIFEISGDGSTAVGTGHSSTSSPKSEAVRWTAAHGIESIGDLPGGDYASRADGVNEDGSVIVGRSESAFGREAFRWEDDGVCDLDGTDPATADCMIPLGDLPGGGFASNAIDVTPDGSIVVGKGTNEIGQEAFVWSAETGMVALGDLPGGEHLSEALGVSADGSVIVGRAGGPDGEEAFLWTAADGMRSLKEVLELDAGLDLEGWTLVRANGVSDDGRVIVGSGRNPRRLNEAWVVELPEPSTTLARLVAGCALAALLSRRMK